MKSPIALITSPADHQNPNRSVTPHLAPAAVAAVRRFHQSLPGYQPTPLVALPELAQKLDDWRGKQTDSVAPTPVREG